jgi:predicted amidophosphoribosyltransferase
VLCPGCARLLRAVPPRWIGGVLIRSAFAHEDPARAMVHRLKYQAAPANRIGRLLVPQVPQTARALVPVPRVRLRRWRYGVDPALELARALGGVTGLPVICALAAPIWLPRRAGSAGRIRGCPRFECLEPVPAEAVLVDDVVTTGTTLVAAARATGLATAVTLTAARSR